MKRVLLTVLLLSILVMAVAPIKMTTSRDTSVKLSVVALAQGRGSGDPPDLTLSSGDIGFTPSEPVVGKIVTITATIHNIGYTNAKDVLVNFSANSTSIGEDGIEVIPKGQSRSAKIDWIPKDAGKYIIRVVVDPKNTIAESNEGNNEAPKTVAVLEAAPPPHAPPPPAIEYELFIEIDYIEGHVPTPEVLEYIEWYYMGNNPSGESIKVTFYVDDVVPLDQSVSHTDFWAIEVAYNNMGDDAYGTGDPIFGTSGVYSSKWKWVLFGTVVEGQPGVVGYCYIVKQRIGQWRWDLLAGNYMFIADEAADNWATKQDPQIEPYGAEAVALMHEMGHSIGIAKLDSSGKEVYDPDRGSVMSYLSTANAKLYGAWYYSDQYWATRNLEYYRPEP